MNSAGYEHDEIEALIAADALDGLEEADRLRLVQIMEEHGDECGECQALTREYAEAAADLASSLEPRALPAGAEDRLVAALRRSPDDSAEIVQLGDRTQRRERLQARAPSPARRWVAGAAAAALVAGAAGSLGYALGTRAAGDIEQLSAERLVAFMSRPGTRVLSFPPEGGQRLAVAFRPGEQTAFLVASGLRSLPNDRVYQLWVQPEGSTGVEPSGTFVPDDGTVVSAARVPQRFQALAVSVEPRGGSEQPTTEPIFATSL